MFPIFLAVKMNTQYANRSVSVPGDQCTICLSLIISFNNPQADKWGYKPTQMLHLVSYVPRPDLILLDLLELLFFQLLQFHELFVLWQISKLYRYTLVILRQRRTHKHTKKKTNRRWMISFRTPADKTSWHDSNDPIWQDFSFLFIASRQICIRYWSG